MACSFFCDLSVCFVFQRKTAYEMRISDWSSDVCSSDLELGTREPTIIRQGDTRIVVQVPGLQNPDQLKALLGQTAKLEFKLVDINALPTDVAAGVAPPGSEIYPYAAGTPFEGQALAVRRLGGIRGDNLTGAQQSFDSDRKSTRLNSSH